MAPVRVLTPWPGAADGVWLGSEDVTVKYVGIGQTVDHIADCDVLWSQWFTPEMGERATSLRLIQSTGAGIERIDLESVPAVCQVAILHEHEHTVAEWVLMAMIALNRDTLRADATMRAGNSDTSNRRGPSNSPARRWGSSDSVISVSRRPASHQRSE